MSLTDKQKAIRLTGIGSSESAAIAGLPAFVKPIEVYQEKTNPTFEREQTFLMRMGHFLEGPNLEILSEREGVKVSSPGTWKHPELPIVDTVDGIATYPDGREVPVEAKLVLPWNAQEFGPEETDEVPLPYYAQCQHHLWARRQQGFKDDLCLMPVLLGVTEWRLYRIPWDPELADTLMGHSLAFWQRHVVPRIPPPPDGTKAYTDYLAEKYPQPQKVIVPADNQAEAAAKAYLQAKAASEVAEKAMTQAANLLRAAVADAEGMTGAGWAATWKADKNGKRTFRLKEGAIQ
jgi:predicted phage-related endonuclease